MDNTILLASLIKQFETIQPYLPGFGDPSLRAIRHHALEEAQALNPPTRKYPTWKYAKLDTLLSIEPKLNRHPVAIHDQSLLLKNIMNIGSIGSLVFINGFYVPALSKQPIKTKISIKHFKAMSEKQDKLLEELLANSLQSKGFFHQLNTALVNDGTFIIIPADYQCKEPILITHFLVDSGDHCYWVSPQTHIYVENNAQANIIENTISLATNVCVMNSQTYITMDPNSHCHYLRIEQGSPLSHSFSHIQISQRENSDLSVSSCSLNGGYHRVEIENNLNGSSGRYTLNGLMLPTKNTHHDWVTKLHHLAPNCESLQSVKSIISNEAHGSYLGLISVNPNSIKTNASMDNHHLLLSKNGKADSSPQLEILCDDVKCNHGSTTGQLDNDEIFYLKSRGLNQEQAIEILLSSYIDTFIKSIAYEPSQQWAKKTITEAFSRMIKEHNHET